MDAHVPSGFLHADNLLIKIKAWKIETFVGYIDESRKAESDKNANIRFCTRTLVCVSGREDNKGISGDPFFFKFRNREQRSRARNIAEFSNSTTAAWATLVGGDSARSSDTPCLPVNNDDTGCRRVARAGTGAKARGIIRGG